MLGTIAAIIQSWIGNVTTGGLFATAQAIAMGAMIPVLARVGVVGLAVAALVLLCYCHWVTVAVLVFTVAFLVLLYRYPLFTVSTLILLWPDVHSETLSLGPIYSTTCIGVTDCLTSS